MKTVAIQKLEEFKGATKVKTTDEQWEKIRSDVEKKLAAKFGI